MDNLRIDETTSSKKVEAERTSTQRNAKMVQSSSVAESLSIKSRSNSQIG